MGECFNRLVKSYPRNFIIELQHAADAAFAEAFTLTNRYIDDPERANMLGQLRHARLESGLRDIAARFDFAVDSPHTNPKGGRYSIVKSGEITLIRGNVQTHRGTPRATKFRKQIAETNKWLSPLQPDFYMKIPTPKKDRLCAVLVVAAQRRHNPSLPGWVGIGFPHHDLASWAEIRSLNEVLSLYHDADTQAASDKALPVQIKDRAIPLLKKKQ